MAFPNPPSKIVPFNSGPVAAHDIGRQFDEHRKGINNVIQFLRTVVREDGRMVNGSIGIEQLDPALQDQLMKRALDAMTDFLDNVRATTGQAVTSAAEVRAMRAEIAAIQDQTAAALNAAWQANKEVQKRLECIDALASAAPQIVTPTVPTGVLGPQYSNFYATDEQGSGPLAQDYAQVSIEWAEHLPDTIPPNILAINAISGDHWSSRWWANRSANAFGMLAWWYQGAWPSPGPPSTPNTPTGDPLPPGSVYFDTTLGAMFVWNGSTWIPLVGSATVLTSATAPSGAIPGMLWFDSVAAQMYVWFDDGSSRQWVPVINQLEAGGGGGGGPVAQPPANTVLPSVTGTASVGQTLTCYQGTWNGSPTSYAFQWERDLTPISGATASTYLLVSADGLHSINCVVTATNANGATPASSNAVVPSIPPAPANVIAPSISGTTSVGQTLTCTVGTWANTPTSYAYQWRRNGVTIPGGTTANYLLVAADGLKSVDCVVTATNASGNGTATSNALSILPAAPVNTAIPTITGSIIIAQTVNCTTGTWNNSPTGYAYQWQLDGVNIVGATTSSFLIPFADGGHNLNCVVTASNTGGSSAISTAVAAIPPPFKFPAGAKAIWSLRNAGAGYAGKCLLMRRKSDGATQDIGFDSQGNIDVASALSFGANTTIFVQKWYDQSGNGYDLAQPTGQSQPQFMIINGKPWITYCADLSMCLLAPTALAINSDQTIGVVAQIRSDTSCVVIGNFDGGSAGWMIMPNGLGGPGVGPSPGKMTYWSTGTTINDTSDTFAQDVTRIVVTRGLTTIKMYANGVQTGSGSCSTSAPSTPLTVGNLADSGEYFLEGMITEIFLYSSVLTGPQLSAIDANEAVYFPGAGFTTPYNGAHCVQFGGAENINFGMPAALQFERTQPWTAFAAIHCYAAPDACIVFTTVPVPGTGYPGYELWIENGHLRIRVIHDITAAPPVAIGAKGVTNVADGVQHFIAATYDGSSTFAGVKAYIDGVPETLVLEYDNLTASIVASGQLFWLGAQQGLGFALPGTLGHFQLDTVVRSASYIAACSDPAHLPPVDANTILCVPLTEGSGTVAHDTSGHGFNGTLYSASMWVPA